VTSTSGTLGVRLELHTRGDGARGSTGFTLDVTFEVAPGVTVLFGPSGAGKSRTLGCIAGIARPDRGRITLGDDVWYDAARGVDRPIHERRAAYVFQSLALFPHMTAEDNVAYGIPRGEADRRARAVELLGKMHVPHLVGRKPRTFSGGEAQRVALARAFAMRPRVLLLDEPFSALDAAIKRDLLSEVAEQLEREAIPALVVTHDEGEARVLGDRIVLLDHGRVVREADLDDPTLSLPSLRVPAK